MLLRGKARNWFELQNNFLNHDAFKTQFEDKFYTIAVQVRAKSKWLNTRFNPQTDSNLQSFYYLQLRRANFLRPAMSNYEKNHSIIQQLPKSARQSLASVDCNQNYLISQTLSNSDVLFIENKRNFENSRPVSQNNDNLNSQAQIHQLNTHTNYRNRGRGFRNRNQYLNNYRNNQFTDLQAYQNNMFQNPQSQHVNNAQPVLPDVTVPPPLFQDQLRSNTSTQNQNQQTHNSNTCLN